jgi:homocysteine S-methyltransferase
VHGLAINCTPSATLHEPLAELVAAVGGRVTCGAWGNVGCVDEFEGWRTTSDFPPPEFAAAGRRWRALGASLVGGCCGTTPEHLVELARALRNPRAGNS